MSGDEWRLDVRTLVWTGRAAQLGLPDSFRLDRLSGRYLRTELADDSTPGPRSRRGVQLLPPRPRQFRPERRGRTGRGHLGAGPDRFGLESPRRRPATPTDHGDRWRTAPGSTFRMTRAPGERRGRARRDARRTKRRAKAMRYTGGDKTRTQG